MPHKLLSLACKKISIIAYIGLSASGWQTGIRLVVTLHHCTMKKVIEILKLIPWIILGGICMLLSLPFMMIVQPFISIRNKIRERQFNEYLKQLEGKNFFCFNNNSKSLDFIEDNILPNLPENVEVIFLNGRTPESAYERKFISHALYGLRNYHGFPHLLKIRNGVAMDESVNNELFNTIQQNNSINDFLELLADFFKPETDEVKVV